MWYGLRARWLVVPGSADPIRDGAVLVHGDRVEWIGPYASADRDVTWHEVPGLLTAGLVNAHTHLQYTGFAALGRRSFSGFEDWSYPFEELYDELDSPGFWRASARDGVRLALESGTTVFAEIITDDPARGAVPEAGAAGIEYLEVGGVTDRTWAGGGRDRFLSWLNAPAAMTVGVSPHAPYSLDPGVFRDLCGIAARRGMRVHSHVGESALERSYYESGNPDMVQIYGGLRDEFALVKRGGTGLGTVDFAESAGLLGVPGHIAHGVYLTEPERAKLRSAGVSVALCPRSNAVIGLDEPPVAALLREGNPVAVGTDSLASSPSLDLLDDVRTLYRIARAQGYRDRDLAGRLFQAATLGGGAALGTDYGTLAAGARADLAGFAMGRGVTDPVQELVERGGGHCLLTVAGGVPVHDPIRLLSPQRDACAAG